jgi:hypothetical protein
MVYINSWQKYQEAAENLYANAPRKVRHTLSARSFTPPSPPTSGPRQARTRATTKKGLADGLIFLGKKKKDSLQRKMAIFGG